MPVIDPMYKPEMKVANLNIEYTKRLTPEKIRNTVKRIKQGQRGEHAIKWWIYLPGRGFYKYGWSDKANAVVVREYPESFFSAAFGKPKRRYTYNATTQKWLKPVENNKTTVIYPDKPVKKNKSKQKTPPNSNKKKT